MDPIVLEYSGADASSFKLHYYVTFYVRHLNIGRIWAIRLQWEWFSIVLILFIIHELVGADVYYSELHYYVTFYVKIYLCIKELHRVQSVQQWDLLFPLFLIIHKLVGADAYYSERVQACFLRDFLRYITPLYEGIEPIQGVQQ